MCGVLGIMSYTDRAPDVDAILRLRESMVHRGPDSGGLWHRGARGPAVLAHRRLAIVDLSDEGSQPMANEDGTVLVTFNGEIYNHAELRAKLIRRGHRFRSRADTEVLVHLYEEHGAAMVDRLVGMFAFGIWDEKAETLLVARDRLGVKPLYWIDAGGRFVFASEIKALLPLLPERAIDPTALLHYLTFACVPPPRTLYRGVMKLAPASIMRVTRAGPESSRTFWDPLTHRADFEGAPIEWERELRLRLERSVERRLMSDVPVGVFLSGGLDSSTNVALMKDHSGEPTRTFSIGFTQAPRYSELGWAEGVARRFGTRHTTMAIDADDLWRIMPRLVHHQDEPIADPVCVPLFFLSRLAKDHGVSVVHVGEGADEILAGYPTYVKAHHVATGPWRRFRSLPGPVRRLAAAGGSGVLAAWPALDIQREAIRRGGQSDAHLWWGGAVAFYETALRGIATPALLAAADGERPRDVVAGIAADADARGARDALDSMIYQDLRLRLPELLLMRVDKLTMANSVEAREPFLDHEVVELAMAMPTSEKIRGGVGKHVLKRAVSDLLPREVVWRPKQGFAVPVAEWFRGELGARLERQIERSSINELGLLDPGRLRRVLDLHRSGRANRAFQLWNILNLTTWFDHWIAGGAHGADADSTIGVPAPP